MWIHLPDFRRSLSPLCTSLLGARAVEILNHRHASMHGGSWRRHVARLPKPTRGLCDIFGVVYCVIYTRDMHSYST